MAILVISEERRRLEVARAEQSEALDRRIRREWLVLLLLIVGWNLIGLTLVGFGFSSPSQEQGGRLVVAGLFAGNGGTLVTALFRVLRMMERGDL